MTEPRTRLDLTRPQILAFRRHVGALDERLPPGPESLRRAAWAGLQDSMPLDGEITGTWRRAGTVLTVRPWRRLSSADRDAVAAEAVAEPTELIIAAPGPEARTPSG